MSYATVMKGGGGGISSSDVTATRDSILKGYSTITIDSDDEIVEGTVETMAGRTLSPSTSAQTIYCSGKVMTSNIVINAMSGFIPNPF